MRLRGIKQRVDMVGEWKEIGDTHTLINRLVHTARCTAAALLVLITAAGAGHVLRHVFFDVVHF